MFSHGFGQSIQHIIFSYILLGGFAGVRGFFVKKSLHNGPESTKQMEEKLNFQVPAEGLELVILLHTQY